MCLAVRLALPPDTGAPRVDEVDRDADDVRLILSPGSPILDCSVFAEVMLARQAEGWPLLDIRGPVVSIPRQSQGTPLAC